MRFVEGGLVRGDVPLLDFVETGEEGHRDEDDDGFLAVADFELCGLKRGFVSLCPCQFERIVQSKYDSRCAAEMA